MTTASTVAVPLLFAFAVIGIFVGLVLIIRREFRQDSTVVVPALTLVDNYPLRDNDINASRPSTVTRREVGPDAHGTAHIGTPARHRKPTVKAITAVPGYGRHDRVNAIGCDSQRDVEEPTGALDWRGMAALLEVR